MVWNNEFSCGTASPFLISANYVEIDETSPENVFSSHTHPQCELYVNLTGNVSFMVESHLYPVSHGNVILTRPYEYHHCVYNGEGMHKHYWFLIGAEGNEDFLEPFFGRRIGQRNRLTFSEGETEHLIGLCHALVFDSLSPLERLSTFVRLLTLLNSGHDDTASDMYAASPVMRDALAYITSHRTEPIGIAEIASAAHVSVNTLERHFAETLHESPSRFLCRRRLADAAARLQQGERVLDACMASGFRDYSYFIALFRREYGMTPLQYKKEKR